MPLTTARLVRGLLGIAAGLGLVWNVRDGGAPWVTLAAVAAVVGTVGVVTLRDRGEVHDRRLSWLPRRLQAALVLALVISAGSIAVVGPPAPVPGGAWSLAFPIAGFVYVDLWAALWRLMVQGDAQPDRTP